MALLDTFIDLRNGRYRFEISVGVRDTFPSNHYGHMSIEQAEAEARRNIYQAVMQVQLKGQQLGIPVNVTYYPHQLVQNYHGGNQILRMCVELWFESSTDRALFCLGEL